MVPGCVLESTQTSGPAAHPVEPNPAGPLRGMPRLRGILSFPLAPGRVLLPTASLVFARPLTVLGEADFVEDEARREDEPERDEHEREVLPEGAVERERAGDADQDEQTGGAEADDT